MNLYTMTLTYTNINNVLCTEVVNVVGETYSVALTKAVISLDNLVKSGTSLNVELVSKIKDVIV